MSKWTCALALSFVIPAAHASDLPSQKVKRLHLKRDEIALVRTAIGIATLIQVPDRPTSVVLGDTNAFKVEYLENAITIKPLRSSAKSNLYIYTEARRFNVSLVTEPLLAADYIVYLEPEISGIVPGQEKWRDYHVEKKNRDYAVQVRRLGHSGDTLMLAFQVTAVKPLKLKPEWIWLTQNSSTVAIQDLNLSGLDVSPKTPVDGFLSVKVSDLKLVGSPVLEFRSNAPIKIRLPEVNSWLK